MDTEQIKQRCDMVARHCVYSSVPSRCSRSCRGTSVVEAYYTLYPEGHYFDDDTMRFFNARVGDCVHIPGVAYLFVTSEKNGQNPRKYTVRIMPTDPVSVENRKMVDTVGEFQGHDTIARANTAMRKAADAMRQTVTA